MKSESILAAHKERIELFIEQKLISEPDQPVQYLRDAMLYALKGGKRIRALLVMLAAELMGERAERVLPAAGAVECFHAYSLVHDDLPAMDNALVRRGFPSVHAKFGEATAILVGDSLIPLGFEWLSADQRQISPDKRVLEVIALFANVLGSKALTGGQYLDLCSSADPALQKEILTRKTAALIEASLLAGAILGGASLAQLEHLKKFGLNLGLAFQYADDLLDWGSDRRQIFMSQSELKILINNLTEEALSALANFGEQAETLKDLAKSLAARTL